MDYIHTDTVLIRVCHRHRIADDRIAYYSCLTEPHRVAGTLCVMFGLDNAVRCITAHRSCA